MNKFDCVLEIGYLVDTLGLDREGRIVVVQQIVMNSTDFTSRRALNFATDLVNGDHDRLSNRLTMELLTAICDAMEMHVLTLEDTSIEVEEIADGAAVSLFTKNHSPEFDSTVEAWKDKGYEVNSHVINNGKHMVILHKIIPNETIVYNRLKSGDDPAEVRNYLLFNKKMGFTESANLVAKTMILLEADLAKEAIAHE